MKYLKYLCAQCDASWENDELEFRCPKCRRLDDYMVNVPGDVLRDLDRFGVILINDNSPGLKRIFPVEDDDT
jgi:hypothetical protein